MQKKQDEALLKAFHLMDHEERTFFVEMAEATIAGRAAARPALQLVVGVTRDLGGSTLSSKLG